MPMFLKKGRCVGTRQNAQYVVHCKWCATRRCQKDMFKVRDGPVDWYFCNVVHAEAWLQYRHTAETYELCRMLPIEKLQYLNGVAIEEKISELTKTK